MIKRLLAFLLAILPISTFSQNIDIDILNAVYSQEALPSDGLFNFISDSHSYVVVGVPLSLGIAGLVTDDRQMVINACEIAAATLVNFGATHALKNTVDRKCPNETYPYIIGKSDQSGPSFPSGHTSSAFATATSLSLTYPKWYVIVPSYLWASSVGYSRMHLGVHYPSDVLCGAVLGIGSAWITHKANIWLNSKLSYKYGIKK